METFFEGVNVYIDGDFEVQYVIENFGKLRNIILNTQDELIEYICMGNCKKLAKLYYEKFTMKRCKIKEPDQEDVFSPFNVPDGRKSIINFDEA